MRKLLTLAACGVTGPWGRRLWQRRQQRQRAAAAAAAAAATSPARSRSTAPARWPRSPRPPRRPFQGREPGREDHGRHLRHRRRLREVLRRRDRHLRRLAADQARRGGPGLQEGRDQVLRGPGRQRRHRRRHQQGPEGRLPHDRPAQEALEQGLEGQEPRARSTRRSPTRSSTLFGPGTDSGTFDFFTDEINGEEGVSREDYQPSADDNVLVQGVDGLRRRPRLLRLLLLRAEPGQAEPGRRRRRAPASASSRAPRTIQDGTYKPLSRPLFMYPSEKALEAARGQGVHGLRDRQLPDDREGRADRADDATRRPPRARRSSTDGRRRRLG